MKNETLYEYNVMKAIAILLVVFAHVTRMFSPNGVVPIEMDSRVLTVVTEFIYLFHMPAFVAIAGSVYYHVKRERGKYKDNGKFIRNKALRLLIPYLFFAIFIVLPTLMYAGLVNDINAFMVDNVVLFSGPKHLWYSVMIFNVFVFFHIFEDKIHATSGFLMFSILSVFYGVSFALPGHFQINGMFRYMVFFYLGYLFQRYHKKLTKIIYSKKITLIVFIAVIFAYYFLNQLSSFLVMRVGLRYLGALLGTAMVYLISFQSAKVLRNNSIINGLAKDSYGIYLFHPMIIYILFYWIREDLYNSYITTIAIFFISLFLSIILVNVFRKLGIQVLVGEKGNTKKRVIAESTQ